MDKNNPVYIVSSLENLWQNQIIFKSVLCTFVRVLNSRYQSSCHLFFFYSLIFINILMCLNSINEAEWKYALFIFFVWVFNSCAAACTAVRQVLHVHVIEPCLLANTRYKCKKLTEISVVQNEKFKFVFCIF